MVTPQRPEDGTTLRYNGASRKRSQQRSHSRKEDTAATQLVLVNLNFITTHPGSSPASTP